ncbi:DUF3099 family protein [Leucobacter luti]|uniref:DUF3099 domain-containing protein n=1 Tax=Leucobacter luti TaxID=340320 RepID=UPI001052D3B5|nr:DUF3099 domain-containing protein [Leucobacter luti]MCW2287755.1 hypothetical protein [Leucobacter luti]TCK46082.1 DUF3099 family protein [Leucobacter luti]
MAKSYSVTSAGVSPSDDRAHRMRMYFFAMALRVLCVVSLFWVRGWWILLVAAGAVLLPWFAVMVGNAVAHNSGEAPDAPAPQQLTAAEERTGDGAPAAGAELIVIDVEPTRRSAAAPPEPGARESFDAESVNEAGSGSISGEAAKGEL